MSSFLSNFTRSKPGGGPTGAGESGHKRSASTPMDSALTSTGVQRGAQEGTMRVSPSADVLTLKKTPVLENPLEEVIEREHAWTIKDIGNNAISGILNDPHVLGPAGSKVFKGMSLNLGLGSSNAMDATPPAIATNIRKVQNTEFDPYIKSLGEVFGRYQLNRALGLSNATEGTPMLGFGGEAPSPSFTNLEEITLRLGVRSPLKKITGPSASTKIVRSGNVPGLETVPAVFLEPEFNMSNPHTFAIVCENGDIAAQSSSDEASANAALQEKLSHYLDTVEIHLIKEISRRSTSFFAALANLQALHQQTYSCVAQITALRKKLSNVSRTTTKKGLEVVRTKRRRGNLGVLYSGVRLVAEVRQTQPMIHSMLEQGDYVAALDMIEHAGLVLRGADSGGEKSPDGGDDERALIVTEGVQIVRGSSLVSQNLDLRRVKALSSFSSQLLQMSRTMGTIMENDLVRVILADVRDTVATMDATKVSSRLNGAPASNWVKNMLSNTYTFSAASPVATTIDARLIAGEERLKSRLLPLVLGLVRMDRLGNALQAYKDALLKEVKSMSKKYYPSLSAADAIPQSPVAGSPATPLTANPDRYQQQQSPLARQLRAMSFDTFFDLLLMVYITLLHVLQRVTIVHEIVVLIVREAQERGVIIGADSAKFLESYATPNPTPDPMSNMPQHPNKLRKNLSEDDDEFGSAAEIDAQRVNGAGLASKDERTGTTATATTASTDGLASAAAAEAAACSTYGQMISESSDVLFSASDLAHVRCAKLIGVRSEQNAQLVPAEFFRLFGATWEFITGGETLCGRMCFGLKGTLLSQAKAFITRFHEEKAKQIAHIVENEQWAQAEVPHDFQLLVTQYFQNTHGTPASSSLSPSGDRASSEESLEKQPHASDDDDTTTSGGGRNISATGSSTSLASGGGGGGGGGGGSDNKSQRHLLIDRRKYNVVACVLLFLKMLTEYIQCMESIPALTTDVLNRIAEALKLFNMRACQVILGAGAMRTAGLKNISAKHIALAAQAIGVFIAVIPHIKDRIQNYLPPKQHVLLGDFDRLLRDYKDHQSELYGKLTSIMEDFCMSQSDQLQAIDWDNPDPEQLSPAEPASRATLEIIKRTIVLHKVLTRYLPVDTMKSVMVGVFKAYNQCIGDKLQKVSLFTGAGKNRLLIDVQYLIQQLSALDALDGPGNHLEVVVNNIKIKDRRASAAVNTQAAAAAAAMTGQQQHQQQQQQQQQQQHQSAPPRGPAQGASGLRPEGSGGAPSPQASSPSAAAAAQPKKTTNFASAFGNMLKTKNAGMPGGSGGG
ncbi:hypothetical protein HDU87_005506 [Geranomyces variabilis]|uniref:Vacuolar protein sorting-associated protein 54 n=1 Tax=Geranomyces variabilis TaxID=109894 RepID=A0AAD5TGT0_9FUNG|nr:hypothetical protein HDU87_005506 [Geranomyces variabilis]